MTATPMHYYVAMHAALGHQCQESARGYEIVFAPGFRLADRADLSSHEPTARRQMQHAGLDPDAVTEAQVAAYHAWRVEANARHASETAFIRITRPQGERQGREANIVELVVSGESIAMKAVRCLEVYDEDATNHLGEKGAYCLRPDSGRIRQALAAMIKRYPDYADAPVRNNAGAEL